MVLKLGKKQRAIARDFFRGGRNIEEVAQEHRISADRLRRWLDREPFGEYLQMLAREETLQASCLLARYSPVAAARLIALTESEKEETRRRACLDILAAFPKHRKETGSILPVQGY